MRDYLKLADAVLAGDPLTEDAALETVIQMGELGIVGNGTNQTVGDFDRGRVEELIAVTVAKMESVYVPAGLGPDDLVTNEFIDENIGL